MADWMFVLMPFLALPIVLLFRFVGCAEFTAAEEPPDFEISVSPVTTGVTQGGSKTVTVTITSKNGFNAETMLTTSGASGVSAVFATNPVKPPINDKVTSTLTLEASPSANAGPVVVTITGTATIPGPADGKPTQLLHSITLTLTVSSVSPVTPDFSLSLTPASRTVPRGQTASYTVNITRVGGFSGAVTLTVNPAGAILSPGTTSGSSSTLTASVPAATAPGTYTFTVSGTGAPGTRTTPGTLVVT